MNNTLRVVSRNSNLAIKQVEEIFSLYKDIQYELISLQSFGDLHKHISLLADNICSDFFTKELDSLLLEGRADIAIHSAKDLPYPLPEGLEVITLTARDDNSDSLVCRSNMQINKLNELPKGTVIGTSSVNRKLELEKVNPNLIIKSIRGTIEERIQQVEDGAFDAVIVATCALKRLGLESHISEILPFQTHPLQGSLAIVALKGRTDLIQIFKKIDVRSSFGKAYLVGAGPGNPDLMTIRGQKIVEKADIVYYDDLIDKSVFEGLNNIEAIYVGKRKNVHAKEQYEINNMMANSVIEGKTVVRLKGGDPMIFAHGGEEVEYLQSNLIEVEVVPGISTANAVASICKIPLTHREIASSLAFVSGHALYGLQIPKTDTLVLYMAGTKIRTIAKKMIEQGWAIDTPVALIHNVSSPDQKEYYYTLENLSAEEIEFPMPIIIIVGKVVELRNRNAKQIDNQKRILVTGLDSETYKHLGKVIHTPLIAIKGIDNNKELQHQIARLSNFQNLLFTSRNTVYHFFEELYKQGKDSRSLQHLKIFSIGKTTSKELQKYGILPDYQSTQEDSIGVIDMFASNNIKGRTLIPRSDLALGIIPEGLRNIGVDVETVVTYQNIMPQYVKKINFNEIDVIVFASPSCIKNFLHVYGTIPIDKQIVVRGDTTYNYLKSLDYPSEQINIYSNIQSLIN